MPDQHGCCGLRRRMIGFVAWLLAGGVASAANGEQIGAIEPRSSIEPSADRSWQTRMDYTRVGVSRSIVLPALDGSALDGPALDGTQATPAQDVPAPGSPLRTGVGRQVPAMHRGDMASTVAWTALRAGERVAALSVRSPGAAAIRVRVRAVLPPGAVLRFFALEDPKRPYPVFKPGDFLERGSETGSPRVSGARTRWSPTVPGDTVGIEIEIPASAYEGEVSLHVVGVSHIFSFPTASESDNRTRKNDTPCDPVQVACKNLPSCPNSAVVRLSFTDEEGTSYLCTGTAVNSARSRDDNLDTPYVLTAAHCIASQGLADTLETRWHYEYDNCEGTGSDPDFTELHGGATLVTADQDTDASLLQLRDALPNNVCLAGWNSDGGWAQGTDVVSLHHPGGEPKQWAGGRFEATGVDPEGVDFILVTWTGGLTVGGSSGSGLFTTVDGADVLIGTLSGGPACTVAEPTDYYGRFDRFFDNYAGVHLQHTDPPPDDDHGDSMASATPVVVGSETSGEIDTGADADVFRITVLRRGTLTVYTTGSVDTVGRLKREDGSTVVFNDDGPNDHNFRIESHLARGVYFVKVTGYNETALGGYRLVVEFVPDESTIRVPLFLAAAALERDGRQGFVRVVNHSDRSGNVEITATDDAGTSPAALTLTLDPHETQPLNSQDLEGGNADKGLSGGTGAGSGDWRLRFESELEIEVGAYVRSTDGFLSAMHDFVALDGLTDSRYVTIFNPASNVNQRSRLRLINPDPENAVDLTITGRDDAGTAGQSTVGLQLAAGSVRTLSAGDLENGGEGLTGALGDGRGKWRLFVESTGEVLVVNLLDSVTGDLTNLSVRGPDNFSE